MTPTEELVARLTARGMTVTTEQATDMALRIGGSVEGYVAMLRANDEQVDAEEPAASGEPVSDKFSDVLAPILETDAESGIPG